jgi:hypothetical protein
MPLKNGYDHTSDAMGTVNDLKGYEWEPRNDSGISEITPEIALELALKRFPFMFHQDEYEPPTTRTNQEPSTATHSDVRFQVAPGATGTEKLFAYEEASHSEEGHPRQREVGKFELR